MTTLTPLSQNPKDENAEDDHDKSSTAPSSSPSPTPSTTTTTTTSTTNVFSNCVLLVTSIVMYGMTTGTAVSLSVMFLDLQDTFLVSRARTAAVHSVCIGILFGGAVIPGYVMNRYGARAVMMTGSFLVTIGMVLSMFATSIDFLIVSTGVVGGFGFCFLHLPIIPCAVTAGATSYKTMVISLCLTASALFSVGNRYVLHYLIGLHGWRATYAFVGGITMNTFVGAMVITSVVKVKPPRSSGDDDNDVYMVAHHSHSDGDCVKWLGEQRLEESKRQDKGEDKRLDQEVTGVTGFDKQHGGREKGRGGGGGGGLGERVGREGGEGNEKGGEGGYGEGGGEGVEDRIHRIDECREGRDKEAKVSLVVHDLEISDPLLVSDNDNMDVEISTKASSISRNSRSVCGIFKDKKINCFKFNFGCSNINLKNLVFLTDTCFILHTIHAMICVASLYSMALIQMDFARTAGFDQPTGVLFLSVVSLASILGRLGAGVADFFPRISSTVFSLGFSVIGVVALLLLSFAYEYIYIICILCLMGVSMGGMVTIYPKVILDIQSVDTSSYPIALGLTYTMEGMMNLVIPVGIGSSVDATGSYMLILVVLGCFSALTTTLFGVGYFNSKQRRRGSKDLDKDGRGSVSSTDITNSLGQAK